jgi:hypothetical protein
MSDPRYLDLVAQFCEVVGLHDVEYIQETGLVEVEGFEAWFKKRCFWVTQASEIIPRFKAELFSNTM